MTTQSSDNQFLKSFYVLLMTLLNIAIVIIGIGVFVTFHIVRFIFMIGFILLFRLK